jgi:peptidoglycan/xylan/chitin deacetylase (PgdA/CDA1 family)
VRTPWFGWFLVAAIGGIAHANKDPMPPEEPAPKAAKPDAKAEAKDKDAKSEAPKPVKKSEADELLALTNDPMFGKADRIDGDELKGLVTFTFDDGPNPDTTPAVMEALKKYDIPATFFIVTQRIVGKLGDKSRDILAKEIAAGFTIASHSVSHPSLKGGNDQLFAKEIDGSIRTLAKEAGRPIGLFRAPFGAFDANGRAWLKKRGLTEVRWSIDTLDWKAKSHDALRKKVFGMIVAQQGGVVLMHDVKAITAGVVADILDDLEAENCKRLVDKKDPIWPVSLHYFVHDNKKQRPIPADVQKRTDAYKANFFKRCAARPKPAAPAPAKVEKPDEKKAEPAKKPPADDKAEPAKKPPADDKAEPAKKPPADDKAEPAKKKAADEPKKSSSKAEPAKKQKTAKKKTVAAKKPAKKKPAKPD